MLPELRARGDRVEVATVREDDLQPYRTAVLASRARLARWNPVDPEDLGRHLQAQSPAHRTFIIRALDPQGGHGIVGKVNVTNVVRGRFQNGVIGYDAYDPYAGRGLFAEGLGLVVGLAFTPDPHGMDLHRLEANVQPGNGTSAGVLRRLGFRREGHIPRMLWLADSSGENAWRDHDSFAITAGEWPAPAYAPNRPARTVVIVAGPALEAVSTTARALSHELSVPHYRSDPSRRDLIWDLLADSPTGGVVSASWPSAGAEEELGAALRQVGTQADRVLHVWCEGPEQTDTHGPLDLPHTVRIDTTEPVTPRTVTALALRARAVS